MQPTTLVFVFNLSTSRWWSCNQRSPPSRKTTQQMRSLGANVPAACIWHAWGGMCSAAFEGCPQQGESSSTTLLKWPLSHQAAALLHREAARCVHPWQAWKQLQCSISGSRGPTRPCAAGAVYRMLNTERGDVERYAWREWDRGHGRRDAGVATNEWRRWAPSARFGADAGGCKARHQPQSGAD